MAFDHLAEEFADFAACEFQRLSAERRCTIDAPRRPSDPTLFGDEVALLLHGAEHRIERAGAELVAMPEGLLATVNEIAPFDQFI